MKRLKAVLLCIAVSAALASNSFAQTLMLTYDGSVHNYTGDILKLKVNGALVSTDIPPVIIDNRSLVPARAVFEELGASVKWNEADKSVAIGLEGTEIVLTIDNKDAVVNQKTVKMDVPAKIINDRTMIPARFVGEQLNAKVGWYPEDNLVTIDRDGGSPALASLNKIEYSPVGESDQVTLYVDNYKDSNIFKLEDPARIVIDLPYTSLLLDQKPELKGINIKDIRYSQYEENTARIVLDVADNCKYKVEEKSGMLVLNVSGPGLTDRGEIVRDETPEPTATPINTATPDPGDLPVEHSALKNIVYHNNGDRIGFILSGVKLTEGDEHLKKLYTETYDPTGKSYTIAFPSSQGDIGTGTMQINDGVLKFIEIIKDSVTGVTSIKFEAEDKYFYEIITRPSENDTAITILKPAEEGEKLVVIDPGHGGSDPGAESFGALEKNFNLDISMRLDKLLEASGVKTYVIREDDSYIGLYERAYIANNLNATLFICIHNNAYYSSSNGTETLYFPNRSSSGGFTGKRFAQIIQSNLVSALGTTNRGIVERPNLVVLKATTMPAALAEIAFMTNKGDFAKLQSDAFKQKAAEALKNSVIQALSEIG